MLLPMGLLGNVSIIGCGLSLEHLTMITYGINNREHVGCKVGLQMRCNRPLCPLDAEVRPPWAWGLHDTGRPGSSSPLWGPCCPAPLHPSPVTPCIYEASVRPSPNPWSLLFPLSGSRGQGSGNRFVQCMVYTDTVRGCGEDEGAAATLPLGGCESPDSPLSL